MSFLGEIKRRKVFQVAAVYLVVAWLIMQVVDVVNEPLNLPDWFATVAIMIVAIGFPITLMMSWAFDLTPEGVVKDQGTIQTGGRRIEYALLGLIVISIAWLAYRVEISPSNEPSVVDTMTTPEVIDAESEDNVLPNSIAILPFENLSPDPDNAYFAAGIHESTLNQLAKIRDLSVIARTSVLQYEDDPPPIPEIAAALKVEMVMEGSVRYANGRVLITAQLIDGRTGTHLWSNEYDRDLADVFAVQADIATRIAMALEAELSLEEQERIERVPTDSPEAYALYLRALDLIGPRPDANEARALSLLEEAVDIDPGFAMAHARLANLYFDGNQDRLATVSALLSLAINPDLGFAYITLAEIHRSRLEGIEAREDYDRAVALSPNDPNVLTEYALFRSEMMQHAEAVRLAERGVELDPNNPNYQNRLARVRTRSGDFDAAATAWLVVGDLWRVSLSRIYSEIGNGNNDAALAGLRDLETKRTEITPAYNSDQWILTRIAYGYSRLGRREDAIRVADQITETPADALASLAAGDLGAALERLNQLVEIQVQLAQRRTASTERQDLFTIKANPWMDPILDQPQFVEVRGRLGFSE